MSERSNVLVRETSIPNGIAGSNPAASVFSSTVPVSCRSRAGCTFPLMSITAIVENDTIKLPVHVPDGTRLEITLPAESAAPTARGTLAERYAKYVGLADDLPPDMAKSHDHYLHGAPKRP